jgi:3'-5' exoribonuclease
MSSNLATPDILTLKVGDQLQADFALTKKERRTTKAGAKPFFSIELTNERGQRIAGKIWSEDMPKWEPVVLGAAVRVAGRIEDGFPAGTAVQLKVMSAPEILPDTHPVRETMNPKSPISAQALTAQFDAMVASIQHPGYRRFVERFFEDACPRADFLTAPAATGNHHAYERGLVEHTLEVTNIAVATASQAEIADVVNLDLVKAGALVHDAGKIEEYVWKNTPIGVSPDALLFNHMTTGPLMVQRTMMLHGVELAALGFGAEDAKHVMHIQVSHHGQLEYGAPTIPGTVAAQIVHQADMTSAHVRKMVTLVKASVPDPEGKIQGAAYGEHRHGLRAEPARWTPPPAAEEPALPTPAAVRPEPPARPARVRSRIEQALDTAVESQDIAAAVTACAAPAVAALSRSGPRA